MLTCALESLESLSLCSVDEASACCDYYCPECKDPIRKRQGQNRAHFYHYQGSLCKWAGVSWFHLKTQLELSARFGGFLEKRFSSIDRIADLFIPSKALVIEVQYSPISLNEVLKRNWDYAQIGLSTLWILHKGHPLGDEFNTAGALFHVPHYFCDMENPHFTLYDFLENDIHVLQRPKIRLKSERPSLNLDSFDRLWPLSHLLWQRHQLWNCALTGDILDQHLQTLNSYAFS